MRFNFLIPAIVILGGLILIGCNANDNVKKTQPSSSGSNIGPETTYADGVRRVTVHELEEMRKNNRVFIVDVRNDQSFQAGHIPGAKLIPATEVLNHLNELPKDKLIVTYCS